MGYCGVRAVFWRKFYYGDGVEGGSGIDGHRVRIVGVSVCDGFGSRFSKGKDRQEEALWPGDYPGRDFDLCTVGREGMMREKKDAVWWLLATGLVLGTVFIVIAVFRGTLYTLHSDDAAAVLLAREQLVSGQLLPKDWSYAYEYWILTLNLLILPFLKMTGQMLLSRELAVVLQFLLFETAGYFLLKKLVSAKGALFGCILLIAPLSFLQMEHFYFQATYATFILWGFVILLLAFGFFQEVFAQKEKQDTDRKRSLQKEILLGVVLCALIVALGCGGTRILGTVLLPVAGSMAYTMWEDEGYSLVGVLKKRRLLVKTGIVCAAMLFGIVAGNWLIATVGRLNGVQTMLISKAADFTEHLSDFVNAFFETYGCFEAEELMSASGILGVFKLVLALFEGIFVPVSLLGHLKELKKEQRFFVIYAALSFVVIFYMMVVCGLKNSYYFLPVYVNGVLQTCIFLEHFWRSFQKQLQLLAAGFLLPIALFSCIIYAKYNYASVDYWAGFNTVDLGLLEFLQKEGLEYGYADFFNAGCYTVASNGAVEIVSVNEEYRFSDVEEKYIAVVCHPNSVRHWLSSERWYQNGYHEGESFILTKTEFLDELEASYRESAERTLTYQQYTILVFEESLVH